ncbi:MAG: Gfo/Idh/MocA family oxidoreductase [Clostridia bacterium]
MQIIALCDIDEKKFTNYKADFNLGEVGADGYDFSKFHLYSELDEMLKNETELDMVTLALPTYLHCWGACKCLEKGINVLCEKPMATTVEDCQKMIDTANKNNVRLMIGQCLRFAPAYLKLKEIVDGGTLGKSVAAFFFRGGGTPLWSYQNWLLEREKGGGALFDQHVHDVDSANFIFGMPEKVSTIGKTIFEHSAYDTLTTNYFYHDLFPVNIQNDWTLTGPYFYQQFRVNFEKGTVVWDMSGFHLYSKEGGNEDIQLESVNPYYEETKYFATTIIENKPITRVPPETSMDTIRIVLAERESADRGGQIVEIKQKNN